MKPVSIFKRPSNSQVTLKLPLIRTLCVLWTAHRGYASHVSLTPSAGCPTCDTGSSEGGWLCCWEHEGWQQLRQTSSPIPALSHSWRLAGVTGPPPCPHSVPQDNDVRGWTTAIPFIWMSAFQQQHRLCPSHHEPKIWACFFISAHGTFFCVVTTIRFWWKLTPGNF